MTNLLWLSFVSFCGGMSIGIILTIYAYIVLKGMTKTAHIFVESDYDF